LALSIKALDVVLTRREPIQSDKPASMATRREIIALAAGSAAAAWLGAKSSSATPHEAAAKVAEFTGGKAPESGKVTIDLPDAVEDGSSVPLAVAVDHPMEADNFISDILVVSEGNPRPAVATFRFTPLSGRAQATTRIRLAGSQTVIVVAKTKDGRFFRAQKPVQVTIGACTGT
jgi:sulfur-oxidizing protein SoxY